MVVSKIATGDTSSVRGCYRHGRSYLGRTLNGKFEFIFLREFSSEPHIAGSQRQRDLADKLATHWTEFGFDKVEKPEYNVLLSFPQTEKPNRVTLVEDGKVIYNITGKIKVRKHFISYLFCFQTN